MHMTSRTLFRAAVVVAVLVPVASAGVLSSDTSAISGWHSSITMAGTNLTATHSVKADVDYAVYTKAAFEASPALTTYLNVAPTDPGNPGDYVYAYQIFNVGNGTALGGDSGVTVLSIALDYLNGAIPTSDTSIGHDLGSPAVGIAPSFSLFVPGFAPEKNAKWQWTGSGIGLGSNSDIVIFTSPFGPQMETATLNGTNTTGDLSLTPRLPSPTPEPATVALVVIGGCGLMAARRIRRRRLCK